MVEERATHVHWFDRFGRSIPCRYKFCDAVMPMRRFDPEDCEHNGPRAFVGESVPGDQPYCLDCWDPVAEPDLAEE